MKKGIHPEYVDTVVTCTCGNKFHTRSTITSGEMRVDVCSSSRLATASACAPPSEGEQLAQRRCRWPHGRRRRRFVNCTDRRMW